MHACGATCNDTTPCMQPPDGKRHSGARDGVFRGREIIIAGFCNFPARQPPTSNPPQPKSHGPFRRPLLRCRRRRCCCPAQPRGQLQHQRTGACEGWNVAGGRRGAFEFGWLPVPIGPREARTGCPRPLPTLCVCMAWCTAYRGRLIRFAVAGRSSGSSEMACVLFRLSGAACPAPRGQCLSLG